MLAALVQIDDGVNLKVFFRLSISKVLLQNFGISIFFACSHLESLHVGDTSAFLIEEAVIHPLPGVQQCLKQVQSAVGIRSFWYLVPKNHMKQKKTCEPT